MSLILEALRKSEAQRQLGRVPGVLAPMPPARRRRARAPLAALVVVIGVAGGWLLWQSRASLPLQSAPTSDPAPTAVHSPPAPTGSTTDLPERYIEIAPTRAETPLSSSASDPSRPTSEPASSPPPSSVAPTSTTPAVSASTARVDGPAQAAPPSPEPGAEEEASLPSVADLLPGERAALPPLRISMHVYADQPAARFVVIDGKRASAGALIADGVLLRAIERDGVVIDAHGRVFRVPRP